MAGWFDLLGLLGQSVSDNNKLALIDMGDVWTDGLPVSSDGISQADKQHLLWEYPGITWSTEPPRVFNAALRVNPMMVTLGRLMNK